MKITLLIPMMLSAFFVFSQEEVKTEKPIIPTMQKTENVRFKGATHTEVRQNKSVTISKKAGEAQCIHDAAYYNEEIEKIDTRIASINTKVAHVNATPSEKAYAEQNGWFEQMEQAKEELMQRRETLIAKRDNL